MPKILKEINMNIMIVKAIDVYNHVVQIIAINIIKIHKIVLNHNRVQIY